MSSQNSEILGKSAKKGVRFSRDCMDITYIWNNIIKSILIWLISCVIWFYSIELNNTMEIIFIVLNLSSNSFLLQQDELILWKPIDFSLVSLQLDKLRQI